MFMDQRRREQVRFAFRGAFYLIYCSSMRNKEDFTLKINLKKKKEVALIVFTFGTQKRWHILTGCRQICYWFFCDPAHNSHFYRSAERCLSIRQEGG